MKLGKQYPATRLFNQKQFTALANGYAISERESIILYRMVMAEGKVYRRRRVKGGFVIYVADKE